jgi:hypothetical protein
LFQELELCTEQTQYFEERILYDVFNVPVQCVYKEVELPVTILDYRDMTNAEQLEALRNLKQRTGPEDLILTRSR